MTLGPDGSNFEEVISSLTGLRKLDGGVDVRLSDGSIISLVMPCISFIGDMPQQNDNAGIKRPTGKRSCRQCLITDEERGNLDYDTVMKGRYHQQVNAAREVAQQKRGTALECFLREYGLSTRQTPLFKIAPTPAYKGYLAGQEAKADSFLVMNTFGPWRTCDSAHMHTSDYLRKSLTVDTIGDLWSRLGALDDSKVETSRTNISAIVPMYTIWDASVQCIYACATRSI